MKEWINPFFPNVLFWPPYKQKTKGDVFKGVKGDIGKEMVMNKKVCICSG